MFDKRELYKHVRWRLFGHPSVVWTTTGGIVSTMMWPFVSGNVPLFVGGVLTLAGGLAAYLRHLYLREGIIKEEMEKAKSQIVHAQTDRIENLRRRLASDTDVRDEELLDQLRTVTSLFREDQTWISNMDQGIVANVLARVDRMFETSIALLDRAFTLRETGRKLRGEGQKKLFATSDRLLEEVKASIEQLGQIYAGVTELSVKRLDTSAATDESGLKNDREALHELLKTAERVEDSRQRMLRGDEEKYSEYLDQPS